MEKLPRLRPGRNGLLAFPRPQGIPCVKVPENHKLILANGGVSLGALIVTEGEWHCMVSLADHFSRASYEMYVLGQESAQEATPESAIYHVDSPDPHHPSYNLLCAFWAGAGYVVSPLMAIRQQPVVVVGQVAGGQFSDGEFATLHTGSAQLPLRTGHFITTEQDGANVRTVSYAGMAAEFSRLETTEGKLVLDFDNPTTPPELAGY